MKHQRNIPLKPKVFSPHEQKKKRGRYIYFHRNHAGFTLMEAVVTLSVIAIVVSTSFVGVVGARKNAVVRDAAEQLASHMREAMVFTQSGIQAEGCDPELEGCARYEIAVDDSDPGKYRREVEDSPDATVLYSLPTGTVFSEESESEHVVFRYCPPMLYVIDKIDDPPSCNEIKNDPGEYEKTGRFCIRHITNEDIQSEVEIKTPSVVTINHGVCNAVP